MVLDK